MPTYTDYYGTPGDLYTDLYGQLVSSFPGSGPVDVRGDVYLGTWTDFTPYVYQRNAITITRGRPNEGATMSPSQATMTLNNRDGRWTIRNPVGAWYGKLVQSSPLRLSVPSALTGIPCYLRLETDTASFASTPDSAPLQITTGTLSVRIDCKMTDSRACSLIGKWGSTGRSWTLYSGGDHADGRGVISDGCITLYTWDGSTQWDWVSTLPIPYFGQRIALRADYNISGQTVTFFTAPTMAGAWTQLGTVVSLAATTLSAAAGQIVQVGTTNSAGMFGEVYEAQIYSTASLVADPVFTSQTPGAPSFTDAQSNTWTLHGTAELSGRSYRFHGELGSMPKAADPTATDVYSDAAAYGITQRASQQQSQAQSAMTRAVLRLPAADNVVGAWPCEDAKNIGGQLAPSIGGVAGTATPQVNLASNSIFPCSAAIPVLNGGQMSFTVPATNVTWTANEIRFLFAVPSGDDPGVNSLICRVQTQGTIARMDLLYTTGGNLTLNCYDGTGVLLGTSGSISFGLPTLEECRLSVQITNAGGGNLQPTMTTLIPGAASGNFWNLSTVAGTIGAVTQIQFGGGGLIGSAVGHVSVQAADSSLFDLGQPLNAWYGERAGARYSRLCAEEGINCRIIGPPDRSQPMGNQTIQTVQQLLQEIETTDQGLQFELRQALGLGYVTNWGLCQQPVLATASYSSAQLAATFRPLSDNQLLVNDVTMTSSDGSATRQVLTTGPTSINLPPAGSGRIDTQVTVNPQSDALQLGGLTLWYLHVRSVDDDRYPAIPFDMARTETPTTIPLLDIGSYLQITGTPAWVPPGPVRQLCAGFTEILGPYAIWTIAVNGIPESPYEVGVVADPVYGHADTDGSTLTTGISSAATTMSVTSTNTALPLWTTNGGDFPFDVTMGGEQITVTAITGTSSPQTFTVTRSVNGVVKAHNAGEDIRLTHPMIVALGS